MVILIKITKISIDISLKLLSIYILLLMTMFIRSSLATMVSTRIVLIEMKNTNYLIVRHNLSKTVNS